MSKVGDRIFTVRNQILVFKSQEATKVIVCQEWGFGSDGSDLSRLDFNIYTVGLFMSGGKTLHRNYTTGDSTGDRL